MPQISDFIDIAFELEKLALAPKRVSNKPKEIPPPKETKPSPKWKPSATRTASGEQRPGVWVNDVMVERTSKPPPPVLSLVGGKATRKSLQDLSSRRKAERKRKALRDATSTTTPRTGGTVSMVG